MKLLFDQNISFRVIRRISELYPKARQVRELELENFSDMQIWEYAKSNGYTIVTFDADFYEITNLKGHPPKIIWLRFGTMTTNNIAVFFNKESILIKEFLDNIDLACLKIDKY